MHGTIGKITEIAKNGLTVLDAYMQALAMAKSLV